MKELLLLTLFVVAVFALPIENDRKNGENGWYVPQQNGSFVWMEREEYEKKLSMGPAVDFNPAQFYLYTQKNPDDPQMISKTSKAIDNSNFNGKIPTRIIIHGWTDGLNGNANKIIRKACLSKGDYNIIYVVWPLASTLDYPSSVLEVESVGKEVASMIDFLVENYKMSLQNLNVIGHSLGAHIAGYAGKNIKTGRIHTIVGLDPALPLFDFDKPEKRLSSTDAFYVETIHTNGGQLGFLKPIGKIDFYANGGVNQPGCGEDPFGGCAHSRSIEYYAEAIEANNFPSISCENYELAVKKECGTSYSRTHMGAPMNGYLDGGEFYVPVNSKPPYGMGVQAHFMFLF